MRHKYPSRITNATYLRRRMRSRTGIIKKVTRNRNTIRWICEEKNLQRNSYRSEWSICN